MIIAEQDEIDAKSPWQTPGQDSVDTTKLFAVQSSIGERGSGGEMIDMQKVEQMAAEYTAAWNSKSSEAVASFYAEDGEIVINRGVPWTGRSRVQDMAAGFYTDVPDLSLTCDDVRYSAGHVVYVWTFTGHDATTGKPLNIRGWEEWELNENLKVVASRGWFDAIDYARQAAAS